jgi:centromeric protein E
MGSPTFGLVRAYHNIDDLEDHCKEVRCIETDETVQSDSNTRPGSNNTEQLAVTLDLSDVTLEQHLENVRRNPISNRREIAGFKGFQLNRSQSCRYTERGSNEWLGQDDEFTPSSRCLIEFPGRPEGFGQRRGRAAVNCDAETDVLSRDESMVSESPLMSRSLATTQNGTTTGEGEFTGINDFVAELKEMAQVREHNILLSPSSQSLNFVHIKVTVAASLLISVE